MTRPGGQAPPMGQKVEKVDEGPSAATTEATRPGRRYPNPWISKGGELVLTLVTLLDTDVATVWQFTVEVKDAHIKRMFQARTDMTWQDFSEIAYERFRKPRDDVLIGYKIAGDAGGVTELTSEPEWNNAIIRVMEKINTARTRAVAMEIRNMVSHVSTLDPKRTDLVWLHAVYNCEGDKGRR